MNRNIYQTITERFVAQLKSGTVPWQKPWLGVQNIVSRKPYHGINALLLGSAEFQSPFWLTFKQALDLGGSIKKGSKSTPVIYYKFLDKTDSNGSLIRRNDGTPMRIPFVRWSNVFNLDQTEGIQPPTLTASQSASRPLEKAAAIVENARLCPIHHAGLATIVLATQAYTSLLGALDKRYADVLMLNLSNELIFTCANDDSAQIASKNIGEREVIETSWGWTGGRRSTNYQRVIKPYFPAYALRKLPKFTAVVRHCEKPFRKRLIPPIHSDGSFPRWFTNQRPEYAVVQWLRGKFQSVFRS